MADAIGSRQSGAGIRAGEARQAIGSNEIAGMGGDPTRQGEQALHGDRQRLLAGAEQPLRGDRARAHAVLVTVEVDTPSPAIACTIEPTERADGVTVSGAPDFRP